MTTARQARAAALRFVDGHRDDLVELACRLVEAPSSNPPGDERAPAAAARDRLRELGFGDPAVTGPREERASLICRHGGAGGGPTLVLNGHLDTKPAGDLDAWDRDPYRAVVSDGTLFGLGAADMKGPCAALVYGLAAAASSGIGLRGRAILALTADEEDEAVDGVRYLVQDAGMRADAVLPVVNASLVASRLLVWLHDHLRLSHPSSELCHGGPTVTVHGPRPPRSTGGTRWSARSPPPPSRCSAGCRPMAISPEAPTPSGGRAGPGSRPCPGSAPGCSASATCPTSTSRSSRRVVRSG